MGGVLDDSRLSCVHLMQDTCCKHEGIRRGMINEEERKYHKKIDEI